MKSKWITPVLRTSLVLAIGCAGATAGAQGFPNKTIRNIFPYPAGGLDTVVRAVGQKVSEQVKQPVVIENKPGGNTIIGTMAVATAPPDGYTLLATSDLLLMNPLLMKKVPYDPVKDFEPVSVLGLLPLVLVAAANLPVSNLKEFIALAKAKPGSLSYGASGGTGAFSQVDFEVLKRSAGVNVLEVPYQGAVPMKVALLSGEISAGIFGPGPVAQEISSGKLKALAVISGSEKRIETLPDVPTLSESGVSGDYVLPWLAVLAPAGTPKDTVRILNDNMQAAIRSSDMAERNRIFGLIPVAGDAATFMKNDLQSRQRAVKTIGLQPQ